MRILWMLYLTILIAACNAPSNAEMNKSFWVKKGAVIQIEHTGYQLTRVGIRASSSNELVCVNRS